MSKYTIELRKVCKIYSREQVENWFKDYEIEDYLTSSQIEAITNAGVWNKNKLARKIVDHYYMREIGFETPYLFKHYAKIKMNEIMERMLPFIYSNSLSYSTLNEVDLTETFQRVIVNTGVSTSTSSNESSGLSVNSDTPQGQISKSTILNGKYASNTTASETTSEIGDSTTSENQNNESFTRRTTGIKNNTQKLIKDYRENIIAIDERIIKELNTLFMGLY